MRILVVDDEGSLLMTLAANLELEGFEVVEAEDGARALEILQRERFDLVLTDIRMPGMSGVELFRRVRRLHPEMPVVLMTAFALEGLVEQAIGEGAFAVLPKPFAIEHVVATLARAAQRPLVLVVDERADSVVRELCTASVAARAAEDEEGALLVVRDQNVDVCVVDVTPEAGTAGPEIVERILLHDPSITFIAVSGRSAPDLMRRIGALGTFAYLSKPLKTAELIRVIASVRGRPVPGGSAGGGEGFGRRGHADGFQEVQGAGRR